MHTGGGQIQPGTDPSIDGVEIPRHAFQTQQRQSARPEDHVRQADIPGRTDGLPGTFGKMQVAAGQRSGQCRSRRLRRCIGTGGGQHQMRKQDTEVGRQAGQVDAGKPGPHIEARTVQRSRTLGADYAARILTVDFHAERQFIALRVDQDMAGDAQRLTVRLHLRCTERIVTQLAKQPAADAFRLR